jgi:hypothetical protein
LLACSRQVGSLTSFVSQLARHSPLLLLGGTNADAATLFLQDFRSSVEGKEYDSPSVKPIIDNVSSAVEAQPVSLSCVHLPAAVTAKNWKELFGLIEALVTKYNGRKKFRAVSRILCTLAACLDSASCGDKVVLFWFTEKQGEVVPLTA